jgi:hypothetical protein
MRSGCALALFGSFLSCCGPPPNPSPIAPDIVFPKYVAVTEGRSTTFPVLLVPEPTAEEGGVLDAADELAATVMPDEFFVSASDYPAMMTVYGVNDHVVNATDRVTTFVGRMDNDDAASSGGTIAVVDIDSVNVIASDWYLVSAPSAVTGFGVTLTRAPAGPITASLVLGNDATGPSLFTFSPTSLTFDQTDFSVPKMVMCTAGTAPGSGSIELRPDMGIAPQKVFVDILE